MMIERAGCCVLRERSWGRDDACAVATDGRGGSAAGVAAVRMVQRADVRRQRVRGCCVGIVDAGPVVKLLRRRYRPYACASAVVASAASKLGSRILHPFRDRFWVSKLCEADGA